VGAVDVALVVELLGLVAADPVAVTEDLAVRVIEVVLDVDALRVPPVRVLDDDLTLDDEVAVVALLVDVDGVLDPLRVVLRVDLDVVVPVDLLVDVELAISPLEVRFGRLVDLEVVAPVPVPVFVVRRSGRGDDERGHTCAGHCQPASRIRQNVPLP